MKSSGKLTRKQRFAFWVERMTSTFWVRFFIGPLLVGALPILAVTYYGSSIVQDWMQVNAPDTTKFLKDYVIWVIIGVGAYPTILVTVARAVTKVTQKNGHEIDSLIALLRALDNVVGKKQQELVKVLRRAENLKPEEAFSVLSQPYIQIMEIVRSISDFFNATVRDGRKGSLIRVSLASFKDGKIEDIPIFFPNDEPVKSSIDDLNSPSSGFMTAFQSRKIVVIQSISKELTKKKATRFKDTGVHQDNEGSLICYPVAINGSKEIPYVLSIHSDEDGFFEEELAHLYELYLQRFAMRLSLEYILIGLKEKIYGQS